MGRHMQQTYLSSPVHFIYSRDQWIVRGFKKKTLNDGKLSTNKSSHYSCSKAPTQLNLKRFNGSDKNSYLSWIVGFHIVSNHLRLLTQTPLWVALRVQILNIQKKKEKETVSHFSRKTERTLRLMRVRIFIYYVVKIDQGFELILMKRIPPFDLYESFRNSNKRVYLMLQYRKCVLLNSAT